MDTQRQRELILKQFTLQAVPFAEMPAHADDETNRLVIETIGIDPEDAVLDVACGPGLITCAAAQVAGHVTGIDITPAMIEQARKRQKELGLTNMTWQIDDVPPLPYGDASFSIVLTRYSFHHFLHPQAVLAEMARVCRPGGRVGVVDVFTSSPEQGAAYDRMEKMRDPSHVRGLGLEELAGLLRDAGLRDLKTAFYKLEMKFDEWLAASFPDPANVAAVRQMFKDDVGVNKMGLGVAERNGSIRFAYPVVIIAGTKSAS